MINRFSAEENNEEFDYGIIVFKHRFDINRPLDCYDVTVMERCIRTGIVYKISGGRLIAEMQIVYKDDDEKLQCLRLDLHDWAISVKYVGDMQCDL